MAAHSPAASKAQGPELSSACRSAEVTRGLAQRVCIGLRRVFGRRWSRAEAWPSCSAPVRVATGVSSPTPYHTEVAGGY